MKYLTKLLFAVATAVAATGSPAKSPEPVAPAPPGLFTDTDVVSAEVLPEPVQTASSSAFADGAGASSRYDPTLFSYEVAGFDGESIDPRTLQVSWEQTDLVVPGNAGLDIVVSRSHNKTAFAYQQMGDWVLGIPRVQIPTAPIYTAASSYYNERPWLAYWQEMIGDTGAAGLCEGAAFLVPENGGDGTVYAAPWVLDIPGEGQKVLMQRDTANTSGAFPPTAVLVTADNWYAECISPQNSPESWGSVAWGGFRVVSPKGTQYNFNMIYGVIPGETGQGTFGGWLNITPSSIEDVNGNRLEYEYFTSLYNKYGFVASQLLYRIVGYNAAGESDGRAVQFSYDPYLGYDPYRYQNYYGWKHSLAKVWVSDPEIRGEPNANDPREVNYVATPDVFGNLLTRVDMPENLSWHFSSDIAGTRIFLPNSSPSAPMVALAKVTFPTGGTVDYSYAPGDRTPGVWRPARLVSRTTQGAAVATGTWYYNYGLAGHLETTTITDPAGTQQHYSFYEGRGTYVIELLKGYLDGSNYGSPLSGGSFMGRLLQQRTNSPSAGLLRTIDYAWGSRDGIGLLAYGYQNSSSYNFDTVGYYNSRPPVVTSTSITNHETGAVFASSTPLADYDIYGHPSQVVESGVDGSTGESVQRTTRYEYFNQLNPWVNGLVSLESLEGAGSIVREFWANGRVRQISRYGIDEHYFYNADGELKRREWQRDGVVHQHQYMDYKRGIAQQELLPDASRISRVVLDSGEVGSETDALGNTYTYQYDELGRLQGVGYPGTDKAALQVNYNRADPRQTTLTRGLYKKMYWADGFGRTFRSAEQDQGAGGGQRIVQTRYDALGRLDWQSYPSDSIQTVGESGISYTYDSLSRVTARQEPAVGAYEYFYYNNNDVALTDYDAQLYNGVVSVDARGYATISEYRSFGSPEPAELMLLSRQDALASDNADATFITTFYTRNALGQLTSSEQDGVSRTWQYNENNLLSYAAGPEAEPFQYEYDEVGNLTGVLQSYRETHFGYDQNNRQVLIDYPGTTADVRFSYLANGSLSTATRADSQWTYTYSPTSKVLAESLQVDGHRYDLSYSYDATDALSTVTYPSGNGVSFSPDAYGRPLRVGSYINAVSYHPGGGYAELRYANGHTLQREIAATGRVSSFDVLAGTETLVAQTYTYDPDANLTAIASDGQYGDVNHGMSYDGLNRLINATGYGAEAGANAGNLRYDANDNLLFKNVDAPVLINYDTSSNRIAAVNGATYRYDAFGNTLGQGAHNFNYDAANQIASVASLPGTSYTYDAFNRRVFSTLNGDKVYSGFNHAGKLMFRINGTQGLATEYAYLDKTLVGSIVTNTATTGPADSDGDLVPDHIETALGTDSLVNDGAADSDNDGLSNFDEFLLASHPTMPDTDGDGLPDGFEAQFGFSVLNPGDAPVDADGDGLSNFVEFLQGTNPLLADTDGDGLADGDDPNPLDAASMSPFIVPILQLLLEG